MPFGFGQDSSDSNNDRWKDSKTAKGLRAGGKAASSAGNQMMSDSRNEAASNVHAVQYRKGGKVRRTGPAIVHRGERVIPRSKVKKVDRMMKRKKMRLTNRKPMRASGR